MKLFGSTLIIAGTCIGAGSLAVPVLTAQAGFLPSIVIIFISWLVMMATGLLFLEVCLWMEGETNIVSMAGKILGRPGRFFAWLIYLYLFYSLTVAYVSGSGDTISDLFNEAIPRWAAIALFIACFAPLIYFGPKAVDKTNLFLVFGLGLAYVLFVVLGIGYVSLTNLQRSDWTTIGLALPLILLSFGYQGIIPTLTHYLDRDPAKVRKAIMLGTSIPLVCYIIWQWLILGIVPFEILSTAGGAVFPLRAALDSPVVFAIAEFFAFFALTSSFLGVTLGLRDFLADGFDIEKTPSGRLALCALIFVPAFAISLTNPHLFILALQYGAGLGGTLLLGLLPLILVFVGRRRFSSPYRLKGGTFTLTILLIYVLLVLATELISW